MISSGECAPGRSRHESAIDDRPDQNHGLGFRPQSHEVADLETAFDADALERADDLLDGVAAAERHQQPFIGHLLAVGILHRRDRIGRPLDADRQARYRSTTLAYRSGPIASSRKRRPFGGIDALVAVGGGEPGALMRNQETCAVALADNVISHHVDHFVVDAIGLKIPQAEAWAAACRPRAAIRSGDSAA